MDVDLSYVHPDLRNVEQLMKLYARYANKAKDIYYGRNRIVFDMGTYVVKLPSSHGGIGDNDLEGCISNGPVQLQEPLKYIQYARTRLAMVDNIPVLLMEKVKEVNAYKLPNMPGWIDYVDCGQVGYTRRGRLVAYDWGRN